MTQTVTGTVDLHDEDVQRFGRIMRAIGIAGVLSGLAAIAVGLWLVQDLDVLLGQSLELTAESITTVDSSLAVATDTVAVVGDGLARAEQTSRGLEGSLVEGADLLNETSRLLRGDIASSLESVQRSMPALIQVGGTIDTTLRAVDQLPVGPQYNPEEPFDETLRALQQDLEGLPADLRTQADTVDQAGANLREVGEQGAAIATSLGAVRTSLDEAGEILGEYRSTAGDAQDLLAQTSSDLDRRLLVVRILIVVLGVVFCAGQALPLYLGNRLASTVVPSDDGDHDGGRSVVS